MSDNTIEQQVKKLVFERIDNRVEDIQDIKLNHRFDKDLGLDSLDTVELVMSIEEAFDIEISDEDASKIETVQDAVNYITKTVSNKQQ